MVAICLFFLFVSLFATYQKLMLQNFYRQVPLLLTQGLQKEGKNIRIFSKQAGAQLSQAQPELELQLSPN